MSTSTGSRCRKSHGIDGNAALRIAVPPMAEDWRAGGAERTHACVRARVFCVRWVGVECAQCGG